MSENINDLIAQKKEQAVLLNSEIAQLENARRAQNKYGDEMIERISKFISANSGPWSHNNYKYAHIALPQHPEKGGDSVTIFYPPDSMLKDCDSLGVDKIFTPFRLEFDKCFQFKKNVWFLISNHNAVTVRMLRTRSLKDKLLITEAETLFERKGSEVIIFRRGDWLLKFEKEYLIPYEQECIREAEAKELEKIKQEQFNRSEIIV